MSARAGVGVGSRPDAALVARLAARADVRSGLEADVVEAFTQAPLGAIPVATAEDVATAFARARQAHPAWAATPLAARAAVLRRFAALVHAERRLLLDVIQAEGGKARFSALDEVMEVMTGASLLAARGPGWLASRRVPGAVPALTRATLHHLPRGVVGLIEPWNFPFTLPIGDALPALLAGNAVVLKPDSLTPLSALLGADLLERAGLPEGVLAVVPGPGPEVGGAVVDACDYLMFTGSTATGRIVGARMGERVVGWSGELGGKNPLIVGAGANLGRAADIACRALYAGNGQVCVSIERVYVEASVAEEFTDVLTRRVRALRLAPGYRFGIDMGCLISRDHLAAVDAHVQDAVAHGARVLTGGRARPDLGPTFYEPTLLADVPPSARVFAEETFGPVVSLYPVADLDEAVERANESAYGLNAVVFCATRAQGEAVARRVRAGTVSVDESYAITWGAHAAPMGGMGQSGVGRRHGREGLEKFTEPQTVVSATRLLNLGGPRWLPQGRWAALLEGAVNVYRRLPGR